MDAVTKGKVPELFYVKISVAFLPLFLLAPFGLWQSRAAFGAALIIGALLQGLVPPRKHFFPVVVIASLIAVAYWLEAIPRLIRLLR